MTRFVQPGLAVTLVLAGTWLGLALRDRGPVPGMFWILMLALGLWLLWSSWLALAIRLAAVVVGLPVVVWAFVTPPELIPSSGIAFYFTSLAGVVGTTVALFVVTGRRDRASVALGAMSYIASIWIWFSVAYYLATQRPAGGVPLARFAVTLPGVAPQDAGAFRPIQSLYIAVRGFIGGNLGEVAPTDDGAWLLVLLELVALVVVTMWVLGLARLERGAEEDGPDGDTEQRAEHPVEGGEGVPAHPPSDSTKEVAASTAPPRSVDLVWEMGLLQMRQQQERIGALDAKLLPLLVFGVSGLGFLYAQPVRLAPELRSVATLLLAIGLMATFVGTWPRVWGNVPRFEGLIKDANEPPGELEHSFFGNFRKEIEANKATLKEKVRWMAIAQAGYVAALIMVVAVIIWP